MSIATYGGLQLFGVAVNVSMNPNANAAQVAAFFGVSGVQAMDGGGRGRVFEIAGIMTGATPAGVQAAEIQLEQYADGVARIFVDNTGIVWPNVVYRKEFSWQGKYMYLCNLFCWGRQYRCVLHGLT